MTDRFCSKCAHVVYEHTLHPQCSHPDHPRDPVTGRRPVVFCETARRFSQGLCGQIGRLFQPAPPPPPAPPAPIGLLGDLKNLFRMLTK